MIGGDSLVKGEFRGTCPEAVAALERPFTGLKWVCAHQDDRTAWEQTELWFGGKIQEVSVRLLRVSFSKWQDSSGLAFESWVRRVPRSIPARDRKNLFSF